MTDGHTRRLQAILAADVVGYSRLMNRDEEGTLARLQALEREVVDPAIGGHGGEIVKRLGDGVLAVFPSAVDALRAARAIREQAVRLQGDATSEPIVYRIGLNVGDVIMAGKDIFGDGVNIASRLEGLADPGGIALSAAVHDNVRAQDPGPFDDLGERQVKNIDHPVRAYRVRFDDSPPLARPAGTGVQRWLIAAGLALVLALGAGLLAWTFWPETEPETAGAASPPVEPQSAPVTPPEKVAPPPAVANSRAAYPDPDTGRQTAPDVPPAPTGSDQPNFGERLVESIADAIEEELATGSGSTGGSTGRGKVPPGQARKAKQK